MNSELDLANYKIKLLNLEPVVIREYHNLEVINGKIINKIVVKEETGIVGLDLGVKDLVVNKTIKISKKIKRV